MMDEPLRVLMVFTVLDRGGAETMVMNYFRRVDRSRVVFDFLVFRDRKGAYEDEARQLGARIFRLPPLTPRGVAKHRRAVTEFFDAHPEYTVVHGHCSELGYFIYREARRRGLTFIAAHAHNTPRGWDMKLPVRNALKRLMRPHLTHCFTCSDPSARWLFGKSLSRNAIFLPNAIDAAAFAHNTATREAVRRREGWRDRFVVGHVGRFSHQKNHLFLIRVFELVLQREPGALLVLVGSGGELEQRVRREVARRGLGRNVVFAGSRTDIAELLQGMDVFVFPSRFEGLSVAMLEAQAAGVKVINSSSISRQGRVVEELVESLPLDLGAEVWAMRVLRARESPVRKDRSEDIIAAGFDINDNAKWLQELYLARR
jgi:glycosyltransferase involved in cell wall biosynthesis